MEVYHASTVVVESPDTTHSRAFIANDKVFRTVDLYFAGDISKEECLRRLIFEEPNNQICIRSQQVLNECLTFKSSQRL